VEASWGGPVIELADILRIARQYWLTLLATTLIGGLAAFAFTLVQDPVYSANSSGLVTASSETTENASLAVQADQLAKSRAQSYVTLAQSRTVAERVIAELGLDVTPAALSSRISASVPLNTSVMQVTAEGGSAAEAQQLADAWINSLAAEISTIEVATVVDETTGQETTSTVTVQLVVYEPAVLPTAPSSPNPRVIVPLGLALGLAAGLAYAFLRQTLDKRIRSVETLEREFEGVPVLGTIPIDPNFTHEDRLAASAFKRSHTGGHAGADDHAVSEALRQLRTNLQFTNVDNPARVLVVTSPLPGDGKSTITSNLAIALAAAGQRVVVIDGDLRRPMLATAFHLVEGAGLSDVLIGRAELVDVLQPWGDTGNLFLLPAGSIPPNPSELLASQAMQMLVQELSRSALVLIDAPPLLPVTDAAILTARCDGAVVVISAGKTKTDELQKALDNLRKASGHAAGIVLNRVPRKGANATKYGYYESNYAAKKTDDLFVPADW
jgi:capsular exopolysaccharide synthesis family protein